MQFLTVILSILVAEGTPLPIATFPDQKSCGVVLEHMLYDSVCTSNLERSPRPKVRPVSLTSPRPKANPRGPWK